MTAVYSTLYMDGLIETMCVGICALQVVCCVWWHLLLATSSCRGSFGWQRQVCIFPATNS